MKGPCLNMLQTEILRFCTENYVVYAYSQPATNCWFSHDVTKIQTTKLSILARFYFHDVLEQLKTNFHTNFCFKRVLGFVIEYAWISQLLRDAAFT